MTNNEHRMFNCYTCNLRFIAGKGIYHKLITKCLVILIQQLSFPAATQTQPPDAVHKAVNSTTLESGNEYDSITEYDYINVGSPASSDKLYVNVGSPSSPDKLVASAVPLNTAIHTLQDQVATLEHSLAKVSTQTSTLQSNLHQLSAQLEVVCSEVKQLKQQVQEQRDEDGSRSSMATNMQEETPVREQNKGYLSSLDHIQVTAIHLQYTILSHVLSAREHIFFGYIPRMFVYNVNYIFWVPYMKCTCTGSSAFGQNGSEAVQRKISGGVD